MDVTTEEVDNLNANYGGPCMRMKPYQVPIM